MEKLSNVVVTEVKPIGDGETITVRLEQIFEKEVTTQSSLLSFTMEGHDKFGTGTKTKRVAFQNFSKKKVEDLKIAVGTVFNKLPGVSKAKIVIEEFIETEDPQGKKARTWFDKVTGELKKQEPKRAGKDGDVLTFQGSPIYRNMLLAINEMDFSDKLVPHDNVITGSNAAVVTVSEEDVTVGSVTI